MDKVEEAEILLSTKKIPVTLMNTEFLSINIW